MQLEKLPCHIQVRRSAKPVEVACAEHVGTRGISLEVRFAQQQKCLSVVRFDPLSAAEIDLTQQIAESRVVGEFFVTFFQVGKRFFEVKRQRSAVGVQSAKTVVGVIIFVEYLIQFHCPAKFVVIAVFVADDALVGSDPHLCPDMNVVLRLLLLDGCPMSASAQNIDQIGDRDAKPAGGALLVEFHRSGDPLILQPLISFAAHTLRCDVQKFGRRAVVVRVGDHVLAKDMPLFRLLKHRIPNLPLGVIGRVHIGAAGRRIPLLVHRTEHAYGTLKGKASVKTLKG